MEQVTLDVRTREERGTSAARSFRREGLVPGVVYGKGYDTEAIVVARRELEQTLTHGQNVLIDLRVDGRAHEAGALAMVKELQRHPLTDQPLSVDFYWVSLTEAIEVEVPLEFVGVPAGLEEGGVTEVHLRDLLVSALPTQIPESIQVDISGMTIGDARHVSDIILPPGVQLRTPGDEALVSIGAPAVEEVVPVAAEEVLAEGEAEAAPAAPEAEADESTS
jgi:large subunit ribosomal protein L25